MGGPILVVGAGMLGTYVTRALAESGIRVMAADVSPQPAYFSRFGPKFDAPLVSLDMLNGSAVRDLLASSGATVVVLAAGLNRAASGVADGNPWQVNVAGPVSVLKAAADLGIRRLVFVSSFAVYGNPVGQSVRENSERKPTSNYGRMKAAAERELQKLRPAELQLVIMRPCGIYGPLPPGRDGSYAANFFAAALAQILATGRLVLRAPSGGIEEYLYIKDVARAIAMAAANDSLTGEHVFNVGSGRAVTGRDVCASFMEVFPGAQITFQPEPSICQPAKRTLDTTHIERSLGFQPLFRLAAGLADYVVEASRW